MKVRTPLNLLKIPVEKTCLKQKLKNLVLLIRDNLSIIIYGIVTDIHV